MIVRTLKDDVLGTDREVKDPEGGWTSRRLSLKDDNMGFSFHDTLIHPGHDLHLWYKNHLETVYCVQGRGEIKDLATGEVHPIENGTIYLLNNHDRHILRAFEEMRLICGFNPPVTGREVHDEDGSYKLVED
ncbi:MAG: ectoine synthase [Fibrobacterota bacterium]